jgi:MFS family permease
VPGAQRGYTALLRSNREFRLLWTGQVVSQLGDWFNTVAVYALLLDLTGTATSVAAMLVVQQLPSAIIGPWAGVVVDRLDRRRVMVAADVLRGLVVLGLMAVRSADTVWLAYALIGIVVVGTAFFEPARSATLPSVVPAADLVLANSLSAATWATMLAVGAAAGGMVASWLGRDVAFVINSLSFFLSAVAIGRMRGRTLAAEPHADHGGGARLLDGLRYAWQTPGVTAFLSIKGAWAVAGGVMLLLTVFGGRVFRVGEGAALGIGVLYAARGVGSGIGALGARRLSGADPARLQRSLAPSYAAVGLCYASLAVVPNLWVAALAVAAAHAAGAILWVSSAVLLQSSVPDAFRGRVFAIEFALLTLVSSTAGYATGLALDWGGIGPRPLAAGLGAAFLVPAFAWWRRMRRDVAASS